MSNSRPMSKLGHAVITARTHLVDFICHALGNGSEHLLRRMRDYFTDNSLALPRALRRANDNTWKALAVALGGDGMLDRLSRVFASGDNKGIRQHVRHFLDSSVIRFDGTSDEFRKACLGDLVRLLKASQEIGDTTPEMPVNRYENRHSMIETAQMAVGLIASDLEESFPSLARLIGYRAEAEEPLLVVLFTFFLRREIETDQELALGLQFDAQQGLWRMAVSHKTELEELRSVLVEVGDRFNELFTKVDEIAVTVSHTHGAVLDLLGEVQQLSALQLSDSAQVRGLAETVGLLLDHIGMRRGEVKPQHSFSIHSDEERSAVKQLLLRMRELPDADRRQLPALVNGVAKLQFAVGDFAGAQQTFTALTCDLKDSEAQAETFANAYRAALEQRNWDEAWQALEQAARIDPERYEPFPLGRYEVKRILGAGGSGTAFLCGDGHVKGKVVIKTLHDLGRSSSDRVFQEARLLWDLRHKNVIGALNCDFADFKNKRRPYLVMEYFQGETLAEYLTRHGRLQMMDYLNIARQIADAMQAAHDKGILHRDLKPDNVLIRLANNHVQSLDWQTKVIDFGLGLRLPPANAGGRQDERTIYGASLAGTRRYAAPEQMGESDDPVGKCSDVWSFGKLSLRALTETTEPLRRHWEQLPDSLARLLEKCIERRPADRWQNFAEIAKALEQEELRYRRRTRGQVHPPRPR